YPVLKGLRAGDRVAAAGAFLIDAETKLNPGAGAAYVGASGGPSSVAKSTPAVAPRESKPAAKPAENPAAPPGDKQSAPKPSNETAAETPDKVTGLALEKPSADDLKNLDKLSPSDRTAALAQQNCPITQNALGSMGVPVKVELAPGKSAFLCCDGCRAEATKSPQKTIEKLEEVARAVKDQSRRR
ncbi:MAG TPA: hypothetical protein VKB78_01965, partial [Pirellulales bacterium]|nr:hypothetical protein [Pirellulales bacterium]